VSHPAATWPMLDLAGAIPMQNRSAQVSTIDCSPASVNFFQHQTFVNPSGWKTEKEEERSIA
jgi:hypothetical protein